jgi:transcriptional regulator with XRE-family HTH domain
MNDISSRLDEAMQLRDHISQSALSRASGVPQPTINRILKGGRPYGPESNTVRKLSDALRVRFEWLMDGKGEMLHEADAEPKRPEGWTVLARVDEFELRMLDLLRQMDDRGQEDAAASLEEIARISAEFAPQTGESPAERQRHLRTVKGEAHYSGAAESAPSKQRKS